MHRVVIMPALAAVLFAAACAGRGEKGPTKVDTRPIVRFIDPGSAINLQPGSVNTIALVPNASGSSQLTNLPRCS